MNVVKKRNFYKEYFYYILLFVFVFFNVDMSTMRLLSIRGTNIYYGDLYFFLILLIAVFVMARRGVHWPLPAAIWYLVFLAWLALEVFWGWRIYGYRAFGESRYILPFFTFFVPYILLTGKRSDDPALVGKYMKMTTFIAAAAAILFLICSLIYRKPFYFSAINLENQKFWVHKIISSDQSFHIILLAMFIFFLSFFRKKFFTLPKIVFFLLLFIALPVHNRTAMISLFFALLVLLAIQKKFKEIFFVCACLVFVFALLKVIPGIEDIYYPSKQYPIKQFNPYQNNPDLDRKKHADFELQKSPILNFEQLVGSGYPDSPGQRKILTEVSWSDLLDDHWLSEVQIIDMTGGSTVHVYYNSGMNRRGPFTVWSNKNGADTAVRCANILQAISNLDPGFSYHGTRGALELITQDRSHQIQAAVRTYHGAYAMSFPALSDVAANTAEVGQSLLIPNISNNKDYRSSVVLFNPTNKPVSLEMKIISAQGAQIHSTIRRTLAGYEMNEITTQVRTEVYSNANILITPISGSGRVMVSGQITGNVTNRLVARLAMQLESGYPNSPRQRLLFPEVNWGAASGGCCGGLAVQIIDITGGSTVQVYYNNGMKRRGPFTLWKNRGGAFSNIRYGNILQAISNLDPEFTYLGSSGSLELITQDRSHLIQAAVIKYDSNYSRPFQVQSHVNVDRAGRKHIDHSFYFDQKNSNPDFHEVEDLGTTFWRLNQGKAALRKVLEKPFFGHHLGGYFYFFIPEYNLMNIHPPHNQYILILLKTGIIGLILLLIPLLLLLRGLFKFLADGRLKTSERSTLWLLLLVLLAQLSYGMGFGFIPLFAFYLGLGMIFLGALAKKYPPKLRIKKN